LIGNILKNQVKFLLIESVLMFWIVQQDLYNEVGFRTLCHVLERLEIPHVFVKPVAGTSKILPGDFDSFAYKGEIEDAPDAEIDESGLVMVCGSLSLSKAAKARGWTPGAFTNDDFRFEKWLEHYGDENILNASAKVMRFDEVTDLGKPFFIRPCEDNKAFTGIVYNEWYEFGDWQHKVVVLKREKQHVHCSC